MDAVNARTICSNRNCRVNIRLQLLVLTKPQKVWHSFTLTDGEEKMGLNFVSFAAADESLFAEDIHQEQEDVHVHGYRYDNAALRYYGSIPKVFNRSSCPTRDPVRTGDSVLLFSDRVGAALGCDGILSGMHSCEKHPRKQH